MNRRLLGLVAAACFAGVGPAGAVDLVDAWRAAQAHDPEFAAAQAARDAGQARREQGASLWRPTLQLSGAVGVGTNETSTTGARFSAPGFGTVDGASFDTSVTQGNLWRWSLQARQPLLRLAQILRMLDLFTGGQHRKVFQAQVDL